MYCKKLMLLLCVVCVTGKLQASEIAAGILMKWAVGPVVAAVGNSAFPIGFGGTLYHLGKKESNDEFVKGIKLDGMGKMVALALLVHVASGNSIGNVGDFSKLVLYTGLGSLACHGVFAAAGHMAGEEAIDEARECIHSCIDKEFGFPGAAMTATGLFLLGTGWAVNKMVHYKG